MTRTQELALVMAHIKKHPKVDAHEMMEFCEKHGIKVRDFSGAMYELLSSFVAEGESKKYKGNYNPVQMGMGILVEMEHTTCGLIAERIAMDHLAEIPDYYTRLAAMEAAAKPIFRK